MEEYHLTLEGKSIFQTNNLMKFCYVLAVLEEIAKNGDDVARLALMALLKQEANKAEKEDNEDGK